MKHLLSTRDLDRDTAIGILDVAEDMADVARRAVPKLPTLQGRTVANLFFEVCHQCPPDALSMQGWLHSQGMQFPDLAVITRDSADDPHQILILLYSDTTNPLCFEHLVHLFQPLFHCRPGIWPVLAKGIHQQLGGLLDEIILIRG